MRRPQFLSFLDCVLAGTAKPERASETAREAEHLRRFVSVATRKLIRERGDDRSGTGEKLELAILFSDMRGFTTWAEAMDPREVFQALNRSLAMQMEAVRFHGGEVDKMLGDGLLARFDGADRARRALLCARDIAVRLRGRGLAHGTVALPVGLAVHEGPVLFGVLGSQWRAEHTVIGDVVNVAARLSGYASPFQVVTTEAVALTVAGNREFHFKPLGTVSLKGRSAPVAIVELLQETPVWFQENVSPPTAHAGTAPVG